MYKCSYSKVPCRECTRKWSCEANKLIGDLTAIRHVCPLMAVMEHCVIDESYDEHNLIDCINTVRETK